MTPSYLSLDVDFLSLRGPKRDKWQVMVDSDTFVIWSQGQCIAIYLLILIYDT